MRMKHWTGYGCINAKLISKKTENNMTTLVIHVSGNHECGIERNDKYDVAKYLIIRFDKDFPNYRSIVSMKLSTGYDSKKGEDTCDYTIVYRKS